MSATVSSGQNLRKSEKFAIIASKGGATMASKYDNMSKEELLAVMKEKNKAYCWRKTCTLTVKEGEFFDDFLQKNDCPNISQFIKKICRGELVVSQAELAESN